MPSYALVILYRSYILPLFDYGDVICDNISAAGSSRLENVQTSAARLILGCMQITSHSKILELSMSPLHLRRNDHVLSALHEFLLGPFATFLANLTPKLFVTEVITLCAMVSTFNFRHVERHSFIVHFS